MYTFSLESVLNHKAFIEEQLQKELAVFKAILEDEKNHLGKLINTKKRLTAELQEKQKDGTSISEIILYIKFIDQLINDADKQKKKILDAEKRLEKKRDELIEAMKNKKTLEKLKEKKMNEYWEDLSSNERDFMNEVAINGFNRRM
ncbi:MAG: flagellar export protein FliJ [Deltaproteobacteria bacterium]|nr:flagellar export protein FliJ [Deltaproteobacteria bacterium]